MTPNNCKSCSARGRVQYSNGTVDCEEGHSGHGRVSLGFVCPWYVRYYGRSEKDLMGSAHQGYLKHRSMLQQGAKG